MKDSNGHCDLDPYYNPDSEHYGFPNQFSPDFKGVAGVRRVCSTQSEVRVYSEGSERWHYLACPIVHLSPEATPDWIKRQKENVSEALDRIARAKWVTSRAYGKVHDELIKAGGLIA